MKRALLALALAAVAAPAGAVLQISANINGGLFFCADQNLACDTNPVVGQLEIANQVINGVSLIGSSQIQVIGTTNFLNTASFQVMNANAVAVPITFAIGGTNFLGPVGAFAASGSGTWQQADGSNLTQTWFADAANTQGADFPTDTPGTLLATFVDVANGAADAFSFSSTGPFVAGGLHSMTLGTSGTLTAGGTLVGRSQTLITTPVPEPATLLLAGLGLLGAGLARRRTAK